jgi:hypothetical protein
LEEQSFPSSSSSSSRVSSPNSEEKNICVRDSKDWVRIDPDFEEEDEYFSGRFSQIRRSKKFTQFGF